MLHKKTHLNPHIYLRARKLFQQACVLLYLLVSVILLLPQTIYEPNAAALSLEDRILRLHILAAGDDTASQEIKLHVRDAVLSHIRDGIDGADTAKEAELALVALLSEIEDVANRTLEECGVSYLAHAELTTEYFPIKQYGSLLLPPGEYRALRIVLGDGDGKNWWCMLYPSLCFTEGITATISEEEKEELRGLLDEDEFELLFSAKERKPRFRLRLLELWKKIWGKR